MCDIGRLDRSADGQTRLAQQRTAADRAELIGTKVDMISSRQFGYLCEAFGMGMLNSLLMACPV
jgi:hypothetical protein